MYHIWAQGAKILTLLDIIEHGNETLSQMHNRQHQTSATDTVPIETTKKPEELQIDWVTVPTATEPEQQVTINWEEGTGILPFKDTILRHN